VRSEKACLRDTHQPRERTQIRRRSTTPRQQPSPFIHQQWRLPREPCMQIQPSPTESSLVKSSRVESSRVKSSRRTPPRSGRRPANARGPVAHTIHACVLRMYKRVTCYVCTFACARLCRPHAAPHSSETAPEPQHRSGRLRGVTWHGCCYEGYETAAGDG